MREEAFFPREVLHCRLIRRCQIHPEDRFDVAFHRRPDLGEIQHLNCVLEQRDRTVET